MGGSVVRGGAWQSSGRVLAQVYTLFVSIVAARVSRARSRWGDSSSSPTSTRRSSRSSPPASRSPSTVSPPRSIGSGRAGAIRGIYVWALRIEAFGAALGGGILVSVFLLGAQPGGAWLAAAAACSASILQTIPNAVLLGAQRWRQASVDRARLRAPSAPPRSSPCSVPARASPSLLAVDACVALFNLLAAAWFVRRTVAPIPPDPLPLGEFLRRARTYALSSTLGVVLSLVVLQRSEIIFLQRFTDDVQIALYSIPFSAVETPQPRACRRSGSPLRPPSRRSSAQVRTSGCGTGSAEPSG